MVRHLPKPKKNIKLAIGFILIADLMAATQATGVKLAFPYFSTNFLLFTRFLTNLIFLFIWVGMIPEKGRFRNLYRSKNWKYHAIRSISGVASIYFLYYGLFLLPVASATLLYFTFPIFVPLVLRIWLKFPLVHRVWWGIGTSFLGIVFALYSSAKGLFNPLALVPLLGAFLSSVNIAAVRALHYTDKPKTILAYFFTTATIVSALIALFFSDVTKEIFTSYSVVLLAVIGVSATFFQIFYTFAFKYAAANFLSPFIYVVFIFTTISDILIWHQEMQLNLIVGFLLITLGAILMVVLYPKERN